MKLKLGECRKGFPKKDGKLIELVFMNLRKPYNVFSSSFRTNWQSRKEEAKDYSFDVFCDLLIKDKQKFIDEGKLGGKQQANFLNGKGKQIYKDRGCANGSGP